MQHHAKIVAEVDVDQPADGQRIGDCPQFSIETPEWGQSTAGNYDRDHKDRNSRCQQCFVRPQHVPRSICNLLHVALCIRKLWQDTSLAHEDHGESVDRRLWHVQWINVEWRFHAPEVVVENHYAADP